MDISSQLPRLPLLDLQTHSPTRPSSAISEVLGPRERIDAIVRHVVKLENAVPTDPRSGQQQRQDLYRVVLQIENRNIEALINRPLQTGQQLSIRTAPNQQVQVIAVDGKPVAAPPGSANTAAPTPVRGDALIGTLVNALRQHLPGQQSSAGLLRNLALLVQSANPQPATGKTLSGLTTAGQASGSGPLSPTADRVTGSTGGPATASTASSGTFAMPRLPNNVVSALERLFASLPTPAQVTEPRALQQAVQNSGLFLEARLANAVRDAAGGRADAQASARTVVQSDLKANLIRAFQALEAPAREGAVAQIPRQTTALTPDQVLRVLRTVTTSSGTAPNPAPPGGVAGSVSGEALQLGFPAPVSVAATPATIPSGGTLDLALSVLLRQLAANISRITVQQVQTAAAQQGAGPEPGALNSWQVELPVRHADGNVQVFQFRIDEEERHGGDGENNEEKIRQWKVTLAFDLAPLGPMYAQIRLWDQHVATRFWAEKTATLQAVRSELDTLKQKLGNLGLQVEELDCMEGAPPVRKTMLSQQLVDVRT